MGLRVVGAILSIDAPPGRADALPCAAALTLPSMALLPGYAAILKTYKDADNYHMPYNAVPISLYLNVGLINLK